MGIHNPTTAMKGQTVRSLILTLAFFGSTGGQLRVEPGEDCWYNYKCETDGASGEVLSEADMADPALACYTQCGLDPGCTDFTVNQFRGSGTCYLLSECSKSFNENCLVQKTCFSGPKDC